MTMILSWTISVIETTPERWMRLTLNISDELLRRPAAMGEWSAMGCLHHLVAAENVSLYRLEAFLSGAPSFPAYNPDAPENQLDPGVSPIELANEFVSRRSASLTLLGKLTEADLQRTARHSLLGQVTLDQMIHEWAAHDLNHTIQAEHALMQPFLAGCGPWIEYFTDHFVK
ncbi:MAG: DinB family protein [Anaerolineales bacterium]|nr:DinB family protein [Anaerolineales bacterium]